MANFFRNEKYIFFRRRKYIYQKRFVTVLGETRDSSPWIFFGHLQYYKFAPGPINVGILLTWTRFLGAWPLGVMHGCRRALGRMAPAFLAVRAIADGATSGPTGCGNIDGATSCGGAAGSSSASWGGGGMLLTHGSLSTRA